MIYCIIANIVIQLIVFGFCMGAQDKILVAVMTAIFWPIVLPFAFGMSIGRENRENRYEQIHMKELLYEIKLEVSRTVDLDVLLPMKHTREDAVSVVLDIKTLLKLKEHIEKYPYPIPG